MRLGEVVRQSFSGGTPSTKVGRYWGGDIPWITSATISEDDVVLEGHLRTITRDGLEASATKIATKGSLVVATRVGVGKAAVAGFDIAISQDLTALLLTGDTEAMYLAWLFKCSWFQASLGSGVRGATIKGITKDDLLSAPIPLPDVEQQRYVVERLQRAREHIDELNAAQEETETRLKTLEQSILDKAFRGQL